MMIGEKIRDSRKEKDMTVKELAEQAAVTTGYISQIERNQIEPSLSVLKRISKILDLPLAALFSTEATGEVSVIPKNKRTIVKFPELNIAYEFITPHTRNGNNLMMDAVYFKLEPKSHSSDEPISHDGDEFVYVIRGKLEFRTADKTYIVEEGGSIYLPKGIAHEVYNPGDIAAEGLGVVIPPAY